MLLRSFWEGLGDFYSKMAELGVRGKFVAEENEN